MQSPLLAMPTTEIVPKPNPRGQWTSASSASRDSLCAGAHLAQRGIPEPPTSEDAASGNRIHGALKDSQNTALLTSLSSQERSIFDSCRAIEKKLVLDFFGPEPPPIRVYREERLWVKFVVQGKLYEHSGEPDCVYVSGAKSLIIDYKTGVGEVQDASSNLQLRDLACLFRGDQMSKGQVIVECATCIVQPLATSDPVICSYKEPDLDRAAKEMMQRIVASWNPKAPRIAGDVQCKWCRAKGVCKEYQAWASATLPVFRDIMALSPANWTPDQRTIFMDRYQVAAQWLEDTKRFLEGAATTDPDYVPGYAMKDGVVKSPITDLKTLLDRIVSVGGTAAGLLTEAGSIAKGDLEMYFKSLIKSKVKGSVAQNKAFEELLAGCTTAKPNKPTLKKL